jgi:hypothetical protein
LALALPGRAFAKKVSGKTKVEVRDKLRELHKELAVGLRPRRRYTVSDALEDVVFAVVSPVNWPAAAALVIGSLIGGWCGPAVVRVLPEKPLRIAIAIAGLGLAVGILVT